MIIKLSKSGKGVVIIEDYGEVHVTSVKHMAALISGRMKGPFIRTTRMPTPAEIDRFEPSPILGKDGEHIEHDDPRWTEPQCSHNIQVEGHSEAGIDRKQIKKREVKEIYSDKVVW